MPSSGVYVVVYDISSDAERDRVSKVLEGYGFRIQESVFECRLSSGTRRKLMAALKVLELKSGFLYVYRVSGETHCAAIGNCPERPFSERSYAYVV